MERIFLILFSLLLLLGCTGNEDEYIPRVGEARLTIDGQQYICQAVMTTDTINDVKFENIKIEIDSVSFMIILDRNFCEEKTVWNNGTGDTSGVMILMSSGYSPTDGWFLITERSQTNIIGEFDVEVYDMTSSIAYSPEYSMPASGVFNVAVE